MTLRRSFFIAGGALLAVVFFLPLSTEVHGAIFQRCQQRCCSPVCCNTTYMTGDQPAALQVHVVGERYDTIEAYFRTDLFFRETLPNSSNLHCGSNVLLAPANLYGTFAIRFGEHLDSFRVYGWKKDQEKPQFMEMTLDPGHEVSLTWITTRILKVKYGPCWSKEYIVRFNDADKTWTELYKTP
jgi:hypothetical protein